MRKQVLLTLFTLPALIFGCGLSNDEGPQANDLAVTVMEDFSVTATVTASHPDNSPFTWHMVDYPSHGTLSGSLPTITYTPEPDYFGTDSCTFLVNDGYQDSNLATVNITVEPVNDPPAETGAEITTDEDMPSSGVTPWTVDVDDQDSFTYFILNQPADGSASVVGNRLVYEPDPDFNGNDSFTFRTTDPGGESVDGMAVVTVNPVNDPPASTSARIATSENTTSPGVTPTVIDVDSTAPFAFTILTQPSRGSAYVTSNLLYYQPNHNGSDSFTFRVSDGLSDSAIATVNITINPVNDPPASTSARIATSENTTSEGVTPTVIDIDSSAPFAFSILTQPSQGSAYVQSNLLYYQPNPSVNGTDSFTYRAFDSQNAYVDGTATVTIGAVNDPPVADSQSVTADEDVDEPVTLTGSDIDGDELTYTIVSQPAHGNLTGTPPSVTYRSDLNYNGSDSFTFRVSDGLSDSDIATVNITVNPVNDPPTGTGAEIATNEDTESIGVTPWVMDADAIDSYTYSILTQPANGSASVTANQLVYDPDPDFNGNDSFTFTTRDSGGEQVDGTATVTVAPVNDPPTDTSASITTDEDMLSVGVVPVVIDVDSGESFSFSILTQPALGTAYVQSNLLYYQPAPDIYGSDSFTYRAFDSGSESVDGTASVTISAVNDPPVANNQSVELDEDTALPVLLTGSDIEGDSLTFGIVSDPAHGTLTGTPPDVTYTPEEDYNGTDEFTFLVNDGSLNSSPGTVRLTINPVADTWYVDINAPGTADGHSWTNALTHPQDAMETAGPGDEVWVAEGVYTRRSGTDSFLLIMTDGVRLYGGFGGGEVSLPERDITAHPTTLDGEDGVTVIYGASGARLDGFTVTGGWMSGMVNEGVDPVIVNCVFRDNGLAEGQDGGAIRNVASANAYIASSSFINNYRSAIYNGNSSPTITNCDFDSNLSDSGGAVKNSGPNTVPYIANSTFISNSASGDGGAISNSASAPLIENCIFSDNAAGGNGGAIASSNTSSPTIVNSLMTGNTAASLGGAVYSLESAPGIINNTIVYNNAAPESGGIVSEKNPGGEAVITNSILWGNSGHQIVDGPPTKIIVTYSDVQGGYDGSGNIDQDPSFIDAGSGEFQLGSDSLCIDTGNNDAVTTPLDLKGDTRVLDGDGNGSAVVDMGAYEYGP